LRDHPFFSEFAADALPRLAAHARTRDLAAGQVLFTEGEVADRFFLVRSGLIALDMDTPDAPDRGRLRVGELGDDSVLGWSWLFPPYRWHLSATALARTSVIEIDADRLRDVMVDDPVLGNALMRRFAALLFDRLQATRRRLTEPDPG
jgi:CRP/FNR family transcriptional regulator, cyclic AMP receptor protein